MILTLKIKHHQDFTEQLIKAKQVAEFACLYKHFQVSSKDVSHFGLPSAISNQILRKYGRNKTIRSVKSANLILPAQSIRVSDKDIYLVPLKLHLTNESKYNFSRVNQIELDAEYAHVSFEMKEETFVHHGFLGIDLNTTGHCAVVAIPETGKVFKLGKEAAKIHSKYLGLRKIFQEQKRFKKLKALKNSESRKVKNLNHQISRFIVNLAQKQGLGIKLEKLTGIRETTKQRKSFRYALHSWSFYQLQQFIEYKAKLLGIPVVYINPEYTSQDCSRCHKRGKRNGKKFECSYCSHHDHADANAAFNIALSSNIYRSETEIAEDGSTDTPIKLSEKKSRKTINGTLEPSMLLA